MAAPGAAWTTPNLSPPSQKAIDCGVNFIDTADVYGMGHSERLIAQLKRERKEEIVVATKAGRRLEPHTAGGYNEKNLSAFVEDSLKNLATDCLDLVQLHCPPTDVYYTPEVFGALDRLVEAGKIRYYGVSVERVEEALKAIEFPDVQTVQIIFNCFRHRPADLFFEQARKKQVGILARVPLASGMLTGKLTRNSQFAADDHRNFNRHGEAFDVGETFSGVDYETALEAVEEMRRWLPPGVSMAQFALRWILMFDAVTCAIPGAKRPSQVADNCAASDLPPLPDQTMEAIRGIYDAKIRAGVTSGGEGGFLVQLLQIGEVPQPAAGLLVGSQILHADQVDRDSSHVGDDTVPKALRELDTRNRCKNLDSKGRQSHPNNLAWFCEQFRRRSGESELPQHRGHLLRVAGADTHPDVDVTGGARIAVVVHGIAANDQVLDFMRVQQPQELFEVGR